MGKIIFAVISTFIIYVLIGYMISRVKKNAIPPGREDNNKKTLPDNQVDPSIYDKDYYLHAYSGGLRGYLSNLENLPVPLRRCFDYADPKPGEAVLDLGCGRGHLAYFCVMKGCNVTAIDYSKDAIDLALKAKEALLPDLRGRMDVRRMDFKDLETKETYDVIFMADLLEHLYDWELKILFEKVRQLLKPGTGRLIIHTAPNRVWINLIFPLKRIMDWPNTLKKKRDFFYTRDKYSYDTGMHVNEKTPADVRNSLKGFNAKVWCDDGSSNMISLITKGFAGADIWAIAQIK